MSFKLALKRTLLTGAAALVLLGLPGGAQAQDRVCERTVKANVVALNQPLWLNRLGAHIPDGMMYALARDVVDNATGQSCDNGVGNTSPIKAGCLAGDVHLRDGKRPRPIVLRANEGDCIQIVFTNLRPKPSGAAAGLLAAEAEDPGSEPQELAGNRALREAAAEKAREDKGLPEAVQQRLNTAAEEAVETAAASVLLPPITHAAGVHVQGLPWVNGPQDDGSYVGRNKSSLAGPGETKTYVLFAEHEGSYLLYSTGDDWSNPNNGNGGADGGTLAQGLFGSVNVQPSESDVKPYGKKWESEWYRSQVTQQDLCLATKSDDPSQPAFTYSPGSGCIRTHPDAVPKIDYQALYPANYKEASRANLPILNMLCTPAAVQKGACAANEIVHTDLTAIITGPGASNFPSTLPPASQPPALRAITILPDRLQPYRELTIIYHESFTVHQAFPAIYNNKDMTSLAAAADNFGINYGMGGIVSEILANRIGVGPMKDCTECKYEEFFLSSWTVGDPAMVVNTPATDCVGPDNKPISGCKADFAKYPADPSNVYQSYLGDHIRFRVLHGGSDLHHVHHQHAHQWLHTPNSPTADYTDSQSIGPGSSFTMEMTYYGGGNLNQTVGDSIFHCHFYAHFASGMWSMLRVFDTLQTGTAMNGDKPATGSRALPDGEIIAGTPIPAIVPMPTLPMAPLPAPVRLTNGGTQVEVQLVDAATGAPGAWVKTLQGGDPDKTYRNPGYPFFIPGIGGRRAPHPPLDFAYACSDNGMRCSPGTAGEPKDLSLCQNPSSATCNPLDGGLPRHLISGGTAKMPGINNADFSKILKESDALQLAETGTLVEKIAMKTHSQRLTPSCRPDGSCTGICSDNGAPCTTQPGGRWQCANPVAATCNTAGRVTFVQNGLPPKPGAPYADPCIKFDRNGGPAPDIEMRRYQAADIQLDAVFNKAGWHFPQQRMISLWSDVTDFLDRKRPPEPLFFRANSNDCIEYTLANLVSNVYELDDFQVRTPTDILGQHIHLVKFDVTSSDGAGNGWNYEDGTFAPNEVTERIHSINKVGPPGDKGLDTQYVGGTKRKELAPTSIKLFGDGPGGTWIGAQATIQRWYSDPLWDNAGACSNNPDLPCTIVDLSRCGDPKATCDVTAGFCSPNMQKTCTASTAVARCGATGECISKHDRTLRTVFTHDHFGPSTHQQAGLYAGLVVEPKGSVWRNNQTGEIFGGFNASTGQPFNKRYDGGPTSWQAVIETQDQDRSYREFLLELQDSTLTYLPFAVRDFNLDASSAAARAQFKAGSFEAHCASREPWEPCGFCGSNGLCVNAQTGQPVSPATTCTVPSTAQVTNPCPTSGSTASICRLVPGQLEACTPEEFDHCAGKPYDDPTTTALDVIKSCKLIAGVPSFAYGSTALNPPIAGKNPEVVTFSGATNTFSFNYRNEPIYQRTTDPVAGTVVTATANTGDMGFVYSSRVTRPNPLGSLCSANLGLACSSTSPCPAGAGTCQTAGFCSDNYALCTVGPTGDPGNRSLCGNPATSQCNQTSPYPPLTPDVQTGDPFTPLLRAYAGDDIQVRTLTGAHLNPHNFTIQGMNWLMEPSFVDSGWRNSEVMGISEHFELISRIPALSSGPADFLYQPGAAALEQAGGNWGLVRAYDQSRPDLFRLPQNSSPAAKMAVCPADATVRSYNVVAMTATQALGNTSGLSYNNNVGLSDSKAILFFNAAGPIVKCTNPASPSTSTCSLAVTCSGTTNAKRCSHNPAMACSTAADCVEPLVLRANAGDCINVKLSNLLPSTTVKGNNSPAKTLPIGCANRPTGVSATTASQQISCKQAQSNMSNQVGFRAQLVAFDPKTGGGFNVGQNETTQTAGPNGSVSYTWYAGNIDAKTRQHIPIEFGASNLMTPDPMNHYYHALVAGLVIEPRGSSGWLNAGTTALVKEADGSQFREFVVFTQDNLNSSGAKFDAVNYKSELMFVTTGVSQTLPPPPDGPNPQPSPVSRFCSQDACNAFWDAYQANLEAQVQGASVTPPVPQDVTCQTAEAKTSGTPQELWCINVNDTSPKCAQCSFTAVTPTFTACAGESVRFRVLHPGGTNTNQVFEIFGHNWSEAPYMTEYDHCQSPTTQTNLFASQRQGTTNLCANQAYTLARLSAAAQEEGEWQASLNTWQGSRMGHGPGNHIDVLIPQAGGPFKKAGDYLYRSFPAMHYDLGLWGIFRVDNSQTNPALCSGTPRPDRALENQLPEGGGAQ